MSTPYNPTADDSLDDRGNEETAQGKPELPTQFAVGTKVRDIYTGEINTVKGSYWQNYAGGNTADYTVEFEPTEAQPTGWNKSRNLREVQPQAEHSPLPWRYLAKSHRGHA